MSVSLPALVPASGPEDPPSSRPLAGVLGSPVYAFRFDPAAGEQRLDLPGGTVQATGDAVLDWAFYADGPASWEAPYPALAVTLDVRFADGSRLSDERRVRDRYGFPLDARAQHEARWSMPEQWNADSVSLAPRAGAAGMVEIVLGAPTLTAWDRGLVTGFVEVRLRGTDADAGPVLNAVDLVDTRRGTHSGFRFSRGNTLPLVGMPHGFTFVTPATDARDSRWPYQPSVHDDPKGRRLEAIQFSHQPSPWMDDRGVLQVMPFAGTPSSIPAARRRWIVAGTEIARPHLWAADLDDGSRVEATSTDHCGAFQIIATRPGETAGFVIDQLTAAGRLTFTGDGNFEGWVPEGDPGWGNAPRTYFAGTASRPAPSLGRLSDDGHGPVAGYVQSPEIRIAVSFLSLAQARRSLAQEAGPEVSFDELVRRNRGAWQPLLSQIEIPPLDPGERPYRGLADRERRSVLAHALYRLHLYPNTSAERDDEGLFFYADPLAPPAAHGDERTGAPVREGDLMVNNGYWDTYRTAWPALALLDPALTARLADGTVEQYRAAGWMARWSSPGYADCMVGTSSDQIFADAERWGVWIDAATAFESGWRHACEPAPAPDRGRKGIGRARFTGFVSRDVHEGMSWSLENAISDAGLARFAERLAERVAGRPGGQRYRAFARYFRNRSLAYRTLFDPDSGFFRGRLADGTFPPEPFDPRAWGGDNVETNAWGMSVTAPHDGAGVAVLHGGPAGLRAHLDALFAEPETGEKRFAGAYGAVIHEQREARAQRSGQCALSNQPAHHIPFMYAFTDRPWRAGATARALAGRLFAGGLIGQGFPGDEDNGEMSAWWIWAALGLYPLELGSGRLLIGHPLLDDVRVRRARPSGETTLHVRVSRSRPGAEVLVSARLNGQELPTCWLGVDALADDAELELRFEHEDDAPVALSPGEPEWAPYRPDLTGVGGSAAASRPGLDAAILFDDAGACAVALEPGEWVEWRFDAPQRVTDLTVTAHAAVPSRSLAVEASEDGTTFAEVPVTHEEELLPDRTTPFTLACPVEARVVRLVARGHVAPLPVALRQLELFALTDDAPRLSR